MSGVRILTVRQPWAWAIIHGGKDVENRTRNIAGSYCGPVAIHSGVAWDWDSRFPVGETPHATSVSLVRGAIIGIVDLVDAHPAASCIEQQHDGDWLVCSEWAERTGYHLVFANPRALDEPIPYKGGLGLRKTNFGIAGDWLYQEVDHCTCGAGASIGGLYGHEPGCGLEPIARLAATS